MRGYTTRWRANNLERARELARASDRKRAGPARAAYHAKWKQDNKKHWRAVIEAWKKRNPEKVKAYDAVKHQRRRAAKLNTHSSSDEHYKRFVHHIKTTPSIPCYWCGKRTGKNDRHIDHIIPLARGGPDVVDNLCCSCPTCNCKKRHKLPEEFAGQFELPFAQRSSV